MSYYWFNKQVLLQIAKEKYDNGGKKEAAKYFRDNKDVIKEKAKNKYRNLKQRSKKKKKKQKDNIPKIDTTK